MHSNLRDEILPEAHMPAANAIFGELPTSGKSPAPPNGGSLALAAGAGRLPGNHASCARSCTCSHSTGHARTHARTNANACTCAHVRTHAHAHARMRTHACALMCSERERNCQEKTNDDGGIATLHVLGFLEMQGAQTNLVFPAVCSASVSSVGLVLWVC